MPVKTERLLHLLGLILASYWLVKYSVNSMMSSYNKEGENKYFVFNKESSTVNKYSSSITYLSFLIDLQEDSEVLNQFIEILTKSKFSAYFFETPSVTKETLNKPFEFVLVDAPQLVDISADEDTFEEYFDCSEDKSVTSFPNLGRDAKLIVPCPIQESDKNIYSSLASFMRSASRRQIEDFWKESAKSLLQYLEFEVCMAKVIVEMKSNVIYCRNQNRKSGCRHLALVFTGCI